MNKKTKILLAILGIVIILGAVLAFFLLSGEEAAGTENDPVKLEDKGDFSDWFGSGKKMSKGSGKTVYFKLTGNVSIGSQGMITGGNTAIVDLNGHTLSGGSTRAFCVDGGSLILKNGTVQTAGASENGGVLYLSGEGSVLELEGVTLTNTDDTGISERLTGGVIYAESPTDGQAPATVTLRGGSVINGSPSGLRRSGGAVTMSGNSRLYVEDATIQGGKAGTSGNVFLEEQSQLHLLGGTIQGGTAVHTSNITGYGGNVYAQALAAVYMRSGIIQGGIAEQAGGNIYLANTAGEESGLHLLGGEISGGTAKLEGGNICATDKCSVVRISGGSIVGGDAVLGGNVFLEEAVLKMHGGTLTGKTGSATLAQGGNIYGNSAQLYLYNGQITYGMVNESGGNIYVTDSLVNIYGGQITGGATTAADVTKGGGNFFAGRESLVRMYGGEISGGISNCMQDKENSAAGGNVMIAGTTRMEMFGGTVKDGMVYGSITRGGSIYVYGQGKRYDVTFHLYGGVIENGLLENKMRGMCIGSYSETKGDSGHGVARVFGGEVRFTGDPQAKDKVYTFHGNKSAGTDLYIFDAEKYAGLYSRTTAGACPDPSHNTQTGELAAGCLTQGCTEYTCATCGIWYAITAEPTGHTETTEVTDLGTKHSCSACDVTWYTEE